MAPEPFDTPGLRERARARCLQIAARHAGGAPWVEAAAERTAWSPTRLRHVYELSLRVHRKVREAEVLVDGDGRVVGFVELGAAPPPAGRWEHGPEALLERVRATGLVPPEYVLERAGETEAGFVEAVLADGSGRGRPRLRARVDPASARVVALEPLPGR